MLSYTAMTNICSCIADRIKEKFGDAEMLLIYDDKQVSQLQYYKYSHPIFEAKANALLKEYEITWNQYQGKPLNTTNNFIPAVVPILPSVKDILAGFADVLALFRTDVKIEGQTVEISRKALVAEMLYALNQKYKQNIALYDLASFAPDGSAGTTKDDQGNLKFLSSTLNTLMELYAWKEKYLAELATSVQNNIKIENAKREIADLEREKADLVEKRKDLLSDLKAAKTASEKKKIDTGLKEINGKIADLIGKIKTANDQLAGLNAVKQNLDSLKAVNDKFDGLISAMTTVNEKNGS